MLSQFEIFFINKILVYLGDIEAYPVAKTTTSAANSVPFSNMILFSVKLLMMLSVFNLILPSAIGLLVPVIEFNKSSKSAT